MWVLVFLQHHGRSVCPRPIAGQHIYGAPPRAIRGAKFEACSHWPKVTCDNGPQVDPSVSAVVHASRSLYCKHDKDFAEFYKSSLLYLAYISSDALPADVKLVSHNSH